MFLWIERFEVNYDRLDANAASASQVVVFVVDESRFAVVDQRYQDDARCENALLMPW
jgi:hypothetical protein